MNVSPAYSVAQPVGMPVTGETSAAVDVPVISSDPSALATSGVALADQPEITVLKNGVVDTSYTGDVAVAIATSDTGTSALTGETFVTCVAGVGVFTDIIIDDRDPAVVTLSFTLDNGRFVISPIITVTP